MAEGDTIGPRDGVQYTVLSERDDTRMDARCGFNDMGVPNGATFHIQTRSYEEWINGNMIRSWTEDIETFVKCLDV